MMCDVCYKTCSVNEFYDFVEYFDTCLIEEAFSNVYRKINENICDKCNCLVETDAFEVFCDRIEGFEAEVSFVRFREVYKGKFNNGAEFIEDYMRGRGDLDHVPIIIQEMTDWEGVWEHYEGNEYPDTSGFHFIDGHAFVLH